MKLIVFSFLSLVLIPFSFAKVNDVPQDKSISEAMSAFYCHQGEQKISPACMILAKSYYQWTDSQGKLHLSDKPHENAQKIDFNKRKSKTFYKRTGKRGEIHLSDKPGDDATKVKLKTGIKASTVPYNKNRTKFRIRSRKQYPITKNPYSKSNNKRYNKHTAMSLYQGEKRVQDIAEKFERKFLLTLYYKDKPKATWPSLKYHLAGRTDYRKLSQYIKVLDKEFAKYPKSFIYKTGLKGIALGKRMQISRQYRSAIPDYYTEILYYDINHLSKKTLTRVRHIIHHEYYHMIEQEIHGNGFYKDPQWAKFNPYSFTYGKGGARYRTRESLNDLSKYGKQGFISAYAMSGLEEDKAETYACLFTTPCWRYMQKRIKTDDVLKKKVDYMKAFLYQLDPSMDNAYYEKMHK